VERTAGVIIMTGHVIPKWLPTLSSIRPIAILTSSQRTLRQAKSLSSAFAGLLKGFADIRELYRVLGELLDALKRFRVANAMFFKNTAAARRMVLGLLAFR
jgi:hypothetical protein